MGRGEDEGGTEDRQDDGHHQRPDAEEQTQAGIDPGSEGAGQAESGQSQEDPPDDEQHAPDILGVTAEAVAEAFPQGRQRGGPARGLLPRPHRSSRPAPPFAPAGGLPLRHADGTLHNGAPRANDHRGFECRVPCLAHSAPERARRASPVAAEEAIRPRARWG